MLPFGSAWPSAKEKRLKNHPLPRTWDVIVYLSGASMRIGTVQALTEELARAAALRRFGVTEYELAGHANFGVVVPSGIYPGDKFDVTPA